MDKPLAAESPRRKVGVFLYPSHPNPEIEPRGNPKSSALFTRAEFMPTYSVSKHCARANKIGESK